MKNHKDKYRWSKKFSFLLVGMALAVLFGSYQASVMADEALEIGDSGKGALFALTSMVSLPAAVLGVGMVTWIFFFTVPTEKTARWMKKENI
jgi:hypothetical protein